MRKLIVFPEKLRSKPSVIRAPAGRPVMHSAEELQEKLTVGLQTKLRQILNLDKVLNIQQNYQKRLQALKPLKIYTTTGRPYGKAAEYDTRAILSILRFLKLDSQDDHRVFDIIFNRPINSFRDQRFCRIEENQMDLVLAQLGRISDHKLRENAQRFVRDLYGAAFRPEQALRDKLQESLRLLKPIMLNTLAKDYNIQLGSSYQEDFCRALVNLCLTKNYIQLNPLSPPYASFEFTDRIFAGMKPEPGWIKSSMIKKKLTSLVLQLCYPDAKISRNLFAHKTMPILQVLDMNPSYNRAAGF